MFLDSPDLFRVTAGIAVLMAVYIMSRMHHSGLNGLDALWVRRCRLAGFSILAGMLGNALWQEASRHSLLLLFYSGTYCLVVNAVAIFTRKEPT
jgi:hypothetical protein